MAPDLIHIVGDDLEPGAQFVTFPPKFHSNEV